MDTPMKDNIIFVDTMAYIFRNFHATFKQGLLNKDGFPTGAIYGFKNSIDNLTRRVDNSKLVFLSDSPGPTFRNEIYPEYKQNRKPAPEELKIQIDPIYELINLMDFPLIKMDGFEADDLIASAVTTADNMGITSYIASGDKDLMSLIKNNIKMLDPKWQILDRNDVFEKMGVFPEDVHLLLSIMGDSADNIPGLRGAGPKTAIKWINDFKTLEGIKDGSIDVKGKIGEKLRDNFDDILLSHRLVELKNDLILDENIFNLANIPNPNNMEVSKFLLKYNIKN